MSNESDVDDTVKMPTLGSQEATETLNILTEGAKLLDEFNALNAGERAWVKWLNSLSEADMKIVDHCVERGILVTPANFDQVKAIVKAHYADDWGVLLE